MNKKIFVLSLALSLFCKIHAVRISVLNSTKIPIDVSIVTGPWSNRDLKDINNLLPGRRKEINMGSANCETDISFSASHAYPGPSGTIATLDMDYDYTRVNVTVYHDETKNKYGIKVDRKTEC